METYNQCGNKYLISRILGYNEPPRKRTVMGTGVHAVMETLARIKLEIQNGKEEGIIESEELGSIPWDIISYDFPSLLTKEEVEVINRSRKNKQTYIGNCLIKVGSPRNGRDFVNSLINKAWEFCIKNKEIEKWNKSWEPIDKTELCNFCWLCIEQYDVRKQKILAVEQLFDLPIEHEDCRLDNGEYVRMKGFIDLITEPIPGTAELVDYKSGQKSNLYTGEIYTLNDFSSDIQLCMYRYAVRKLYPEIRSVMASILYLRDGGLFTPEELENSDEYIFDEVKKHIVELKNCKEPSVFSENREDFRCKHICWFARSKTFDENKCDCQFIKESVRNLGLAPTTELYKKESFNV